jgi:general secretion pathway protein H
MVVIVIAALAATAASIGLGALTRAQLRSGAMKVAAAARFAYNRAVAQGTTVRVTFDMDEGTMVFEEAHGRITLARTEDPTRERLLDDGNDEAAVDPWTAARARLEEGFEPSFGASPFAPISGYRYRAQTLARGVVVTRMYLPHEPEPREEGRGSVHFFPSGETEHAILHLSDGWDRVFSVELHPLTGRARIRDFAYEPEEPLTEDGRSELRDRRGGVR